MAKPNQAYPPPTIEQAEAALYHIPADCPEAVWKDVGMALSSEFPDQMDVFDRWSRQAPEKYKPADVKARWTSWKRKRGKGIATLFKIAKEYGYQSEKRAPLSPAEQAKLEADRARRQAEADKQAQKDAIKEAEAKAHAIERAADLYNPAQPATAAHGYCVRKGIQPHDGRIYKGNLIIANMPCDGSMMYPIRDFEGNLKSLQFIHPDIPGKDGKRNLPIAELKDYCWQLGKREDPATVYLAEGPATAASIYEATDHLTLCTISAGRFQAVAQAIRQRHPEARLIFCADDDKTRVGIIKAILAAQAVNGLVTLPVFRHGKPQGATDFNDLHHLESLEAVRLALAQTQPPGQAARDLLDTPGLSEGQRRPLAEAFPELATPAADPPAPAAQPQAAQEKAGETNGKDTIKRLAQMEELAFLQQAKAFADGLGITPGELKQLVSKERTRLAKAASQQEAQGTAIELYEPEPWPIAVNGETVLNEAYQAIKKHMAISNDYAFIAVLWIVHSHIYDVFSHTPRLIITAPNAECGKSVLLHYLIGNMATRPLSAEDLTLAVFFRLIETYHPTLLIDECDVFFKRYPELMGNINAGFEYLGRALRCVGEDSKVMAFSTWVAMVMAGIKLHKILPPSTLSRSFVIILDRALDGEIAEYYDREKHEQLIKDIGRKIARWCADHKDHLKTFRPTLPPNARNRRADKWRPLFAIAQTVGGAWPDRVLNAYYAEEKSEAGKQDTSLQLLNDIREVWQGHERAIYTNELIERLCGLEDAPWPEYNFKERDESRRKLQDRQLAKLLKDYGIKPAQVRPKPTDGQQRGYWKADFEVVWRRYLADTPAKQKPAAESGNEDVVF